MQHLLAAIADMKSIDIDRGQDRTVHGPDTLPECAFRVSSPGRRSQLCVVEKSSQL